MLIVTKDEIQISLRILRRKLCCYDGLMGGTAPKHCDCKFGYDPEYGGEHTGCPELRTIEMLLDKLSDYEFLEILNREK